MTLTLTDDISATDVIIDITGTVPESVLPGYAFRLDDEVLEFYRFEPPQGPDPNVWRVARGSHPVMHTAGTVIRAITDAIASSDDETPPTPFAGSGGGISVLGPFRVNFDDAAAINPNDWGLATVVIPEGSLFQAFAMPVVNFDVGQEAILVGAVTSADEATLALATYDWRTGQLTTPRSEPGLFGTTASDVGASGPRWAYAVGSDITVYIAIYGDPLAVGALDVYAIAMAL